MNGFTKVLVAAEAEGWVTVITNGGNAFFDRAGHRVSFGYSANGAVLYGSHGDIETGLNGSQAVGTGKAEQIVSWLEAPLTVEQCQREGILPADEDEDQRVHSNVVREAAALRVELADAHAWHAATAHEFSQVELENSQLRAELAQAQVENQRLAARAATDPESAGYWKTKAEGWQAKYDEAIRRVEYFQRRASGLQNEVNTLTYGKSEV